MSVKIASTLAMWLDILLFGIYSAHGERSQALLDYFSIPYTCSHMLKTNHLSLVKERTAQGPLSSPPEMGQRDLGWVEFIRKRFPPERPILW